MTDVKTEELEESYQSALRAARDLAGRAHDEERDFTDSERAEVEKQLSQARRHKAALEVAAEADRIAQPKAGGPALGHPWSRRVLAKGSGPWGFKGLLSSASITVPPAYDPSVASTEPRRTRFVQSIIPTEDLSQGERFSYMRQTVRTFAAAPVPEGQAKPVSTLMVERLEDRCRVIAHLSEPVARQTLADAAFLQDFIEAELRYGLVVELEDQILNGDGVGENFTGISNTSGIQVQAWDTDLLTTSRRPITTLESVGLAPTAYVMAPGDWERFELLQDNEGKFFTGGPVDRAASRLFGLPVVVSPGQPSGLALLGDWRAARLYMRQEATVEWSEAPEDGFRKNLISFRAEQRTGFAVLRPASFVEIDLTP